MEIVEIFFEKRDVFVKEMDVVLVELEVEKVKLSIKEESNIILEFIDFLDVFMLIVFMKIGMLFVLEWVFLYDSFCLRMLMYFVFKE